MWPESFFISWSEPKNWPKRFKTNLEILICIYRSICKILPPSEGKMLLLLLLFDGSLLIDTCNEDSEGLSLIVTLNLVTNTQALMGFILAKILPFHINCTSVGRASFGRL